MLSNCESMFLTFPIPSLKKSMRYQARNQRGGGGGGLPCPFLKIKKSALILEKKCPDCVYPQVKFAIQNVVLRVSKRKNFKNFPCGAFFLGFLIKCLSKCPNFTKLPLPRKFLVARLDIHTSPKLRFLGTVLPFFFFSVKSLLFSTIVKKQLQYVINLITCFWIHAFYFLSQLLQRYVLHI